MGINLAWVLLAGACSSGYAFTIPLAATKPTLTMLHAITTNEAELDAFTNRDREMELAKLANKLEVSPDKVRALLAGQRKRLTGTEAKARQIDWLLNINQDQEVVNKSAKRKKTTQERKAVKPKQQEAPKLPVKGNEKKSVNRDANLLTDIDFADRSDLHPSSKRALEKMGLKTMTEIQEKTYAAALSGKDVLGRARTGTGKTVAFLLPAIERVLRSEQYENGLNVGVLVISPTRELANQIGDEAEKLLAFHKRMSVQVVFGGTKVTRDISRLKSCMPTVLVATPGRLMDLLDNAKIQGTPFSKIMSSTPLVVLDETDQLLDMGFRREIQKILTYLPRPKNRQMLLFSATIPQDLKEIMSQTMKPDYVEVDCIRDGNKDGEGSTQTHAHIKQSHAIIPSIDQLTPAVIRVVKEAVKDDGGNNKIVVFFPTARMVSFFADLFNLVVNEPVFELHSKKAQGYRNRVSAQFREARSGILFTSDVSARGVDYPGVSHVIQFGIPSSRDQYVHRLGRTGRAGAKGKGWLLLTSFESMFLEELKGIDITTDMALVELLNKDEVDETDDQMLSLLKRVQDGDQDLVKSGEGAYQAFLGYYLGQMKRLRMKRKERLVEIANQLSSSMGFRQPPKLNKNMIGKMGLKGIPGLLVSSDTGGAPKQDGRSWKGNHHNKDRGNQTGKRKRY